MRRHAVSSYVPGSKYHGYHWPQRGRIDQATVVEGMPDTTWFKVLALPCRHPGHLHWGSNALWAVVAIDEADYVENDGFVNFRAGEVVFTGQPREACGFLREQGLPVPSHVVEVNVAGDWAEALVGEYSVAVAGNEGRAIAGGHSLARVESGEARAGKYGVAAATWGEAHAEDHGMAFLLYEGAVSVGDFGVAVVGEFSEATAGGCGVAISDTRGRSSVGEGGLAFSRSGRARSGDFGCAIVTDCGDASSGKEGLAIVWGDAEGRDEPSTAFAGEGGLAVTGEGGHARAGDGGIALAGIDGIASAGRNGTVMIQWWDETCKAIRVAVGHVDERNLKPNVPYRLNDQAEFVPAEEQE